VHHGGHPFVRPPMTVQVPPVTTQNPASLQLENPPNDSKKIKASLQDRAELLEQEFTELFGCQSSTYWSSMMHHLKVYKEEHGDCLVPISNKFLGLWTRLQRARNKAMLMSPREIFEMEQIGFEWVFRCRKNRKSFENGWNSMLERLIEYKRKHGNLLVPQRYKEDIALGTSIHYGAEVKHDVNPRLNIFSFLISTQVPGARTSAGRRSTNVLRANKRPSSTRLASRGKSPKRNGAVVARRPLKCRNSRTRKAKRMKPKNLFRDEQVEALVLPPRRSRKKKRSNPTVCGRENNFAKDH